MVRDVKTEIEVRKRREDIAVAFFEGYSVEEIVEYGGISRKTVLKDVEYIKNNKEEFY